MKAVCILLLCMAAVAFAYFEEDDEEYIFRRGAVTKKKLIGGYVFKTTLKSNGKYKCECFLGEKKIWAGMCGVRDKKFSYSDCE